jgi:hypothetical protein
MFHDTIILHTARTPSNCVTMFHEPVIQNFSRVPSNYVAIFRVPITHILPELIETKRRFSDYIHPNYCP